MAATSSRSASLTLPADDQILITREFDAPRHLVYRAWTEPELIRRWWHAKRGEVTAVEVDLRPGGRWRYAMVADGGLEVGFHGEYREVVPNEKIVSTEAYEGIPDPDANATLNTVTFEEADGRTTVTILVQAPSKDVRDAIIASGMEDGLQDALDLLEEIAVSLR
ncbi:MAG TPA: SRPBCC family protein [Gaiellaceae bacterium]|nr:SRPBCC family protein [Gaiellaceae bacterium]